MADFRKKIIEDTFLINALLLSLLVVALAVQVLIITAWAFSFIPIKPSPLLANLFLRHQALVVLKRDIFFYHFFVAMAVILQVAGFLILKSHLSKRPLIKPMLIFVLVEYGWVFLMVFAVFKMFVYGFAPWTKGIFYFSLTLSVLSKIFWSNIVALGNRVMGYWEKHKGNARAHCWYDLFFVLLIFLIIYIPDIQGLLSWMFITDHFNHFDGTIMGSAWVNLKGGVLNVDQFTIYSLGFPIVVGHLASLMGKLSYASMATVLVIGTAFYYIGVYALARFWLKSIAVAMAMVILLIKWQMFHPGVAPIIFNYPSATIWRYPLDIVFLFLILSHLRRSDWRFLGLTAVVCGFSLFYMLDTGVYMAVACVFYIGCTLILDLQEGPLTEVRGKVLRAAGMFLTIPVSFLACIWLAVGHNFFIKAFWENLTERAAYFVIGYGALPIYKSLVEGKFLESWMGFFIPCVYTFVLITVSTLCFLKKISRENLFIATLSVYGLGSYHYYICRSADTSYYVVALPFVFILGYMLNRVVAHPHAWRRPLLGTALAASFFALLTNHWFLDYPNLLNLSKNPITHPLIPRKLEDGLSFFNHNDMMWTPQLKLPVNSLGETDEKLKTESDFADDDQLKDFFSREFNFSQDADLISSLTDKGQKVPLISSFETRILIQADRRPFFFYYPFVDPRPMHMRMFDMSELWSIGRLRKTMAQLQDQAPAYIFMERIYLAQSVPQYYEYLYPDLLVILNYIHQHYIPYQQGHYLVAMKRKDSA